MIIRDLSHLEVATEEVAGGYLSASAGIFVGVKFGVISGALVYGNTAGAEAEAGAYGWNTFTSAQTVTVTTPYSSVSGATSISATN